MKVFVFQDRWFIDRLVELTCDDHIKQMVVDLIQSETTPSSYVYDIFRMYLVNYAQYRGTSDRGVEGNVRAVSSAFPNDNKTVLTYDGMDVLYSRGLHAVYEALSSDLYEDICNALIDRYGQDRGVASVEDVIEAIKSIVTAVETAYLSVEGSGQPEERIIVIDRPNSMILVRL